MRTTKRSPFSWREAIYFGEVFGFVLAWIVGLLVLSGGSADRPDSPAAEDLASVSERASEAPANSLTKID